MAKLESTIAGRLKSKNKTLAVAESCTGGLLSHRLTNISGSSAYFKLGVICYSYESKIALLKVPRKTLAKFGAVSRQVAILLAKNIRRIAHTDLGVGITGIAGPTGATAQKPVGLVYIAVADKNGAFCRKFIFKGKRLSVKLQASQQALKLLKKLI
jgi:PncC family amidohydrolase